MTTFLSFFIFLICSAFLFYAGSQISGSAKKLTLVNIFCLYFIFNNIPSFGYSFLNSDGIFVEAQIQILLVLSMGAFFLGFGVLLGGFFASRVKVINLIVNPSPMRILFFSVPFLFLGIFYMLTTEAYMALFHAVNGDIVEAMKVRTSSTNALSQHGALYSLPFIYIFPALSLVSFIEYKKRKKIYLKKNNLLLLVMFIVFTSLSVSYSIVLIQKYYIVQLGLFFLFAYSLFIGARISYLKLFGLFFVAVIGLSSLWAFYSQIPLNEVHNAPMWVLERIFYANLDGLNHYVDYYNEKPLLLGKSFPNTLGLLPYEPISITKIISANYIMTSEQLAAGLVGSHPTIFLGEIMVNFGYIGCIAVSIYLGSIIGFLSKYILRILDNSIGKSATVISVYAMLTIWSLEVVTGSAFSFLHYLFVLNELILVTLVLLFCISRLYKVNRKILVQE